MGDVVAGKTGVVEGVGMVVMGQRRKPCHSL